MRSLWSITYVGAHTATTIKKVERLLDITALDIVRERYIWNAEKVERATFFVEHDASEWPVTVVALLRCTALLAMKWETRGDAVQALSVTVSLECANSQFKDGIPSGLVDVSWELRADQTYVRNLLTPGSAERW